MKDSSNLKHNALPKQLLLGAIVLAAAVLAGFSLTLGSREEPKQEATPDPNLVSVSGEGNTLVDIKTEAAKLETWQSQIQTTGILSYPGDQTVKIAPRLTGRIGQMYINVGDRVTVGQPIATLLSVDAATAQTTNLQNQNLLNLAKQNLERSVRLQQLGTPEVTAAEAALDQAKAATAAAKDLLDRTKLQSKIGGFTEKPLEDARNGAIAAQSALSLAQSDLSLASKDLERKKKLEAIGVAAKADLEISQDSFEKAKTTVDADVDSLKLAKQAVVREQKAFDTSLYSDQQIIQSESTYRQAFLQQSAAEKALRLAKAQLLRDLQQAQSDFRAAQFNAQNSAQALVLLDNPGSNGSITIKSPITGLVVERDVNPGQVVDQSQMAPWQLCVISNSDSIWLDADVYERDLAAVSVGQPVTVKVAAVSGRVFQGKVQKLAPTLDRTSRSVKARVIIPNAQGLLKDGEYAEVSILTGKPYQGLTVPWTGIEHEGDNDYVFIQQGAKYAKKQVHLGQHDGARCEVTDGLKVGDQVVTHGAIFLGGQSSGD